VELQAGADNSMSNNVSNNANAMMRQVANGISFRSNHLETALGERDSGMEAPGAGEHHYQTVELSPIPIMENPRIERGSVDDCLYISSTSAEEKEDEEDIFVCICTLCYSNYSARCVDRRYPFLTNDPRDPLEIMEPMEECDNTFRIPSQYCFFNIEELKHHTEMHHPDPLLNESNPNNLLESLYDDDDKVRTMTMTTTTKQFAHDPSACRTHCLPRRQWGWHLLVHEYFFKLNVLISFLA
jgi:hypothetical protein